MALVAAGFSSGHGKMRDRLAGHFVLAEMGIKQGFEGCFEFAVPGWAI
jgi:hypothetical protein